jgi:anti-sigma factor RsiW
MKCINEEQLQRYLDGECSQAECELIRQHLDQCQLCADAFAEMSERSTSIKRLFDKTVIQQPEIPEFMVPAQTSKYRNWVIRYLLPAAAAAGLLLMLLFRPFHKTEEAPLNGFFNQSYISVEFDANKPVTEYPLIITAIAPDGSVSQIIIN